MHIVCMELVCTYCTYIKNTTNDEKQKLLSDKEMNSKINHLHNG